MRRSIGTALALLVATGATPAMALERYGQVAGGSGRGAAVDPERALERMAAASTPAGSGRSRPPRSARSILKNDPNLRAAFAWLDNK